MPSLPFEDRQRGESSPAVGIFEVKEGGGQRMSRGRGA
ncbi:hypothetical protein CCACVL1_21675 [Corchorus capsularis]|uniref:Uncharacterized protein n=1 Tax=Corchorus capsularis TaxID=210143 RepID=A0A1R3H2K8_COCAP|nr:hypothetical protein CCACVL1_21675 [Corchorus capsularis]